MLTDWLRVAERIAVALERMADAAEAQNAAGGHHWGKGAPLEPTIDGIKYTVGAAHGSQRDG